MGCWILGSGEKSTSFSSTDQTLSQQPGEVVLCLGGATCMRGILVAAAVPGIAADCSPISQWDPMGCSQGAAEGRNGVRDRLRQLKS